MIERIVNTEKIYIGKTCVYDKKYNDKVKEFVDKTGDNDFVPIAEGIKHRDLLSLKNGNSLIAGKKYKITDYIPSIITSFTECKTVITGTSVIIVTALTSNILDENAILINTDGSTVEAFDIKYKIDMRDPVYQNWSMGMFGTIYEMTDQYGNQAPYDFINIKVRAYYNTDPDNRFLYNRLNTVKGEGTEKYVDTFTNASGTASARKQMRNCKILPCFIDGKMKFNSSIMVGNCTNTTIKSGRYNTIVDGTSSTITNSSYCFIEGNMNSIDTGGGFVFIRGSDNTVGKSCNLVFVDGIINSIGNTCTNIFDENSGSMEQCSIGNWVSVITSASGDFNVHLVQVSIGNNSTNLFFENCRHFCNSTIGNNVQNVFVYSPEVTAISIEDNLGEFIDINIHNDYYGAEGKAAKYVHSSNTATTVVVN